MFSFMWLFFILPVSPALQRFAITRTVFVPTNLAFDACLRGWREDNFKLPIPPPIVVESGDPIDGTGFEIARVPPFFLRERISTGTRPEQINYEIVNPGVFTWPVSMHKGSITFTQAPGATELSWTVEWEPLPGFDWLVRFGTKAIISAAADYVEAESFKMWMQRDGPGA